jgi:RND family efflux transporter MFP subunit
MNKRTLLIAGIIALGVGLATVIVKTAPKPERKSQAPVIPLVEVAPLELALQRPTWQAGASVNANASVNLVSQVAGQVMKVNDQALPGRFVKKGDVLAVIDDSNYRLIVKQRQAAYTQAKASLDMEQGQVERALADYKLSGMQLKKEAKSLALRKPQLASAKAAVAIALAELNKAKLDLDRTKLKMPFDGYVLSQSLSEGAFVNSATPAFNLVKSDEFWLEIKVPQAFVRVLDESYPVVINKVGSKKTREARVLSVLPQVDQNDRQIRVLVSIDQPLSSENNQPVVRYNDYVKATLFGQEFAQALRVNTDRLNGREFVWVVDSKLTLQQRSVEVLFKGRQYSWIKLDAQEGDALLASDLPSMKVNMVVRLPEEKKETSVAREDSL